MKSFIQIFSHFFYLGCISFGGPAAHLGYFQRYFVIKHQWLDMQAYSRIVALSQFLPGPSSSQVGFSLGYHHSGLSGAIAAFLGFTLPSFLLLYLLAVLGINFSDSATFTGAIYGLKLFAVVIVADAVISMSKVFCQQKVTRLIALITMILMIYMPNLVLQLVTLFIAGIVGVINYQKSQAMPSDKKTLNDDMNSSAYSLKLAPLLMFLSLLLLLPVFTQEGSLLALFNSFFQAGSLVFGGGHVVMPLLHQTITQPIATNDFILGYASAQAVPGPMFTLATYLGAILFESNPFIGALVATLAIFLPGFLLLISVQGVWLRFAYQPKVAGFVMGVNAAVVGLLAAAFYQPIAINAIFSWQDMVWVTLGFILLKIYRLPIIAIVACFVALGIFYTL